MLYPTACSPQAWATGAPFLFVQAMLGLRAEDGELRLDPCVPEELGRIVIRRLHACGAEWDVEAAGTVGEIRHVKSLFEKTGVASRQELVARVFLDDYLPHVASRTPLSSAGGFVRPGTA